VFTGMITGEKNLAAEKGENSGEKKLTHKIQGVFISETSTAVRNSKAFKAARD
jgi:hypothetical protein